MRDGIEKNLDDPKKHRFYLSHYISDVTWSGSSCTGRVTFRHTHIADMTCCGGLPTWPAHDRKAAHIGLSEFVAGLWGAVL